MPVKAEKTIIEKRAYQWADSVKVKIMVPYGYEGDIKGNSEKINKKYMYLAGRYFAATP